MKNLALIILILLTFNINIEAQSNNTQSQEIQWLSWEEMLMEYEKEPKAILVFIDNKKDGYSKRMKTNTFADTKIVEYVSANYYPVKIMFTALKNDIVVKGKLYQTTKGDFNSAFYKAFDLGLKEMANYAVLLLSSDQEKVAYIKGYQDPERLMPLLKKQFKEKE